MKKLLQAIVIALAIVIPCSAVAGTTFADPLSDAKAQACVGVSGVDGGNCGTGATDINTVIKVILNVLSLVAGLLAVVMIIVGGLKYITSGGESNGVSSAKKTLTYAIVGLVVVALAQTIVHFVLANIK